MIVESRSPLVKHIVNRLRDAGTDAAPAVIRSAMLNLMIFICFPFMLWFVCYNFL